MNYIGIDVKIYESDFASVEEAAAFVKAALLAARPRLIDLHLGSDLEVVAYESAR